MRSHFICALLLLLGTSCSTPVPRPGTTPFTATDKTQAADSYVLSAAQLSALHLMAVGDVMPPAELALWQDRLTQGTARTEDYLDHLLSDDRVAGTIAPSVILRSLLTGNEILDGFGFFLQSAQREGQTIYYLRTPCELKETVFVQPWWNVSQSLRVCPEAYRPERIFDSQHNSYCGLGINTSPDESLYCGCGPFLLNCFRDSAQVPDMTQSLLAEVAQTTRYIVQHDRPLQHLFTSNETFRDRNAEIWQQRTLLISGKAPVDLRGLSWPAQGKWSPRPELLPGQHAGILTTPHMMYFVDSEQRPRMKTYFDIMWCKETDSLNVDAADIFKLGTGNIRAGEGWERLAAMPICTNCHARLDHAMQFFQGYPNADLSTGFVPTLQKPGIGWLYGNHMGDLRGQSERTPQNFARLAVTQPEFESCMVRNVIEHVLNNRATSADQQSVRQEFRRSGSFKAMLRVALLRWIDKQRSAVAMGHEVAPMPGSQPTASDSHASIAVTETVAVPASVWPLIESNCRRCHSDRDGRPFVVSQRLPREMTAQVLSQVAFGRMPKGKPLDPKEKRAFVMSLIQALWSEPTARAEAIRYYGGSSQSVHRLASVLRAIQTRATGTEGKTAIRSADLVEWLIRQDVARYTPGLATTVALEALQACKRVHPSDEAALRRCVEQNTRPEEILKVEDVTP